MDRKDETTNQNKPRRRRGGQPGNKNALKHGLYQQEVWAGVAPRQPAAEPPDHTAGLLAEVTMLRILIRRLFDSSNSEESTGTLIEVLRALGVATARMRLVAIEKDGERLLGEYTFNHTPTRPA